jgi:enamine deaminase RidA (YjgF/YER057c/UK114 family)
MEKKSINPWNWQDKFSFSQGVEITGSARTLLCAGQTSISSEGLPLHKDDFQAQLGLTLENVESVLLKAGYDWAHIVRLTVYTTDVDEFFQHYDVLSTKLQVIEPKPIINILGINRLVFPELMVEIEVTAIK